MIGGLHSSGTQGSSNVGAVQADRYGDQGRGMGGNTPQVHAVRNDWRGGYTDKILGAISAASMGAGAVMMLAGGVMKVGGESEIENGMLLLNHTMTEESGNTTKQAILADKAFDSIKQGNSAAELGTGVMAFGAGLGFMGLGMGAECLRRRLCGGPPRQ